MFVSVLVVIPAVILANAVSDVFDAAIADLFAVAVVLATFGAGFGLLFGVWHGYLVALAMAARALFSRRWSSFSPS